EELTYMIKYQNAYNASSRFINVINEMIETLLTQVG
nr:flagellar basal body rod C-terminal domain-containing protein [Lachnospira sp.]